MLENEILIAILSKQVDERLALLPALHGPRGPRGHHGVDGKDFIFEDHEAQIRLWAKEFALKFEDFTAEQIGMLRGPRGQDGADGKDFIFEDHAEQIRSWASEFALKFEDLNAEQIGALRGPRGQDGEDGKDGTSFVWDAERERISEVIRSELLVMSEGLKLKFADLSHDDIEQLRGPRGRDGRSGRDFVFDEHAEYFSSLRLKFSDLTASEVEALTLHFSDLTEDEKASLRLRFEHLTEEDRALIRGPRGVRGQKGSPGRDGVMGPMGARGLPGLRGIAGLSGLNGVDGRIGDSGVDGVDAPRVVAVDIEEYGDNEIAFVFEFSDGAKITSDRVKLPAQVNVYSGGGASKGGRGVVNYDTRIDEASDTITYVGKTVPGNAISSANWQVQRISVSGTQTIIEFADSDAKFDNVWNARASLVYG